MLSLVKKHDLAKRIDPNDLSQAGRHHAELIESYIRSHRIRNHSDLTIKKESSFLKRWFVEQGYDDRPLYAWEAMSPDLGRIIAQGYIKSLLLTELSPKTVRNYLGTLNRFFSFLIEHPFVTIDNGYVRVDEYYRVKLLKPFSEFDIPGHSYDGEDRGVPLDPESLYEFFAVLRSNCVGSDRNYIASRSRNYAMVVLAGETGLRLDEIRNLEIVDLFFDGNKIQTRQAKGAKGSGKKSRISIFSPLARDTMRHYIKVHRPTLISGKKVELLFPSRSGRVMTNSQNQVDLKQMCESARKAGFPILPHMSWHWLRRIFATRFIERFPDKMAVLIQLLGHSNPHTVHRYIRHSDAWMDEQIRTVMETSKAWPYIGN